jgi:hypothetical protein
MAIFKNLDDKIKCPKCGYTGTSAIGGQASCPLGHGLFPYQGQSELDAVLKQTTDALARLADEVRRAR